MYEKQSYHNVYVTPGGVPVFCYRSGLAVYEESLINGVLVSSGYNTAGYPLNVLTNCATRLNPDAFCEPSSFHIEVDGQSIDYGLKFVDFTTNETETQTETILTLESELKPVRLKIHTILDGTQMFTRFIEIENLSDVPMNVSRMVVLGGGLEIMERNQFLVENDVNKLYSVGYFDATNWGREGAFAWHELTPDILCIDSRFNRDRFRHPVLFIRNNVTGTIYFSQIAWSAGCRYTVDYQAFTENERSTLAFGAEITAYNPMLVLKPGETFTTPEVHMGAVSGSFYDAVNEMHAHIRKSVLCVPEASGDACLVGAGMGAEHDMSVETSKAFMRQFAEMGAEIFIIDAGWVCPPTNGGIDWFGYNGINIPNSDRYPNGMEELSDYCHSLGMKFALWVEIERLGAKSGVLEQHPDWIACDYQNRDNGGYLDLTNPEAFAWAESELARIITELKLDLLRVDYNVSHTQYFALRDLGTGRKECLSLRHFQAVYQLYGNLKRRFPHVIFENCAGGGGRTDLGIMKAFNHTWVSDWQKAPISVLITNGMTMVLPPERVDRLFAGMGCHAFGSFDLHMRNTMLGHMSLNVVAPAATEANPIQMEFVRHSVDIYKNFIRKFLPTAKIYHHTPDTLEALQNGHVAIELASSDQRQGVLGVFTLAEAKHDNICTSLKGIDPGLTYKVTLDNSRTSFTLSGYELMTQGITVKIPASLSSELVLYEAVYH